MEMISSFNQEKIPETCGCLIRGTLGKCKATFVDMMKKAKKIGEDDPRRIIHSMKVGLALSLVSLFYYFRPLYDGFGQAGMWAVLTVVVVFEYTVGGTLSKSINRGFATLIAGALGVGAEYLARLGGEKGEPIVLGLLVFFLATISTFMRFFPHVKRRYDYGVLIFILTFSLVAVSGYRVGQILQLAHQRLSTILIGGASCILISVFVCPVWAGQDLHNMVAGNLEKLSLFLEGFGREFFSSSPDESNTTSSKSDDGKSFLQAHKSVLNSKANEESLANFAWWEPGHGSFRFQHPWKLYLNIGILARECACLVETLAGCITSKSQVASDLQLRIQQPCMEMTTESGKLLKELATAIKKMRFPSSASEIHARNSKAAAEKLKSILETASLPSAAKPADLRQVMPLLVVSSVLIDIIKCVEKISMSVDELSHAARFQTLEKQQQLLLHRGIVKPVEVVSAEKDDHVTIEMHGAAGDSPENDISVRPMKK